MINAPQDVSPGTGSSGINKGGGLSLATWNIRSGRNGGLDKACRALEKLNVSVAILQETKITNAIYTRRSHGYSIVMSEATSATNGEFALA